MTNESTWHRINSRTVMLSLMGEPAFVYTASSDTDTAMDAASQFHGAPLDYGEAEEYEGSSQSDHPALDGDEIADSFLLEHGFDSISVLEVWPSEAE